MTTHSKRVATKDKASKTKDAKEFIKNFHERIEPILKKYPRKSPVPIEKMSMFA